MISEFKDYKILEKIVEQLGEQASVLWDSADPPIVVPPTAPGSWGGPTGFGNVHAIGDGKRFHSSCRLAEVYICGWLIAVWSEDLQKWFGRKWPAEFNWLEPNYESCTEFISSVTSELFSMGIGTGRVP